MRAAVAQPSAHVLPTSPCRKEPQLLRYRAGTRGCCSPGTQAGLGGVGCVNSRAAGLLCTGRGPISTFLDS